MKMPKNSTNQFDKVSIRPSIRHLFGRSNSDSMLFFCNVFATLTLHTFFFEGNKITGVEKVKGGLDST